MTRITTVAFLAALVAASGCSSKKTSKATEVEAPTKTSSGDKTAAQPTAKDTTPAAAGSSANLNNTIYFEFDQSALSADARAKLDQNAEWLREDAARKITIEGHTDEVGTPEYNLGLGDRRARATKDYLVHLGIDASRIDIITYGEERPASTDDSQNRRSMFVATQKKDAAAKAN
jgi:peptidoglycan-associated lipoprotein